ncbi:VOC family protein [Kitasatospora sp. NPDC096147]|uniref:VOC family protein n=1 Tax=Kitasatospora sp. NPDC096147 TaxID=3364093 RepID=UPI00382D0256
MLSTDFRTGSPNWLDLGSPDTAAAAAFYGAVFGWSFEPSGSEAGGYGFFRQDGRTVAALGPLTEEGAHSAWTVYFHTPEADSTAKSVEQAGGTVRVAPDDVFDAGRLAAFTDPAGGEFAVWQPNRNAGLEATTVPGTLCWVELHTPDPAGAQGFYGTLFDWRYERVDVPGMTYTVVSTADGADQQRASFGGIAPTEPGHDHAAWLPYFEVTDPDATIDRTVAHGGAVLLPGMDAPGIGRMAWLTDPAGARFAIIRSEA